MKLWISIYCYLWRNTFKRWVENPLPLLSKVTVSFLISLMGALVILGVERLGMELEKRLKDREALKVVVTEDVTKEWVGDYMDPSAIADEIWEDLGCEASIFLKAPMFADVVDGERVPVWALTQMEAVQMDDDLYYVSPSDVEGAIREVKVSDWTMEAQVRRPIGDLGVVMYERGGLLGSLERMRPLLKRGFTKVVVMHARDVDVLQKIHHVVTAMSRVEGKRLTVQSHLAILQEIAKVSRLQANALVGVTLVSSLILGLVYGSLVWMEFLEGRYLMSLIRSFGVNAKMLLIHAVIENCVLSVTGVMVSLWLLKIGIWSLNLEKFGISKGQSVDLSGQGILLIGALLGGIFSCIPIGIGLRKPIGLVLK